MTEKTAAEKQGEQIRRWLKPQITTYAALVALGRTPEQLASRKADDLIALNAEFKTNLDATGFEALLSAVKKATTKKPLKGDVDEAFILEFNHRTQSLVEALRTDTVDAETYKVNVTGSLKAVVDYADSYQSLVGTTNSVKRADPRRMMILAVGRGGIKIYFGGWGDGSKELRNQYGNGRPSAHANSDFDGDLVAQDIRLVLKVTSPYINGQAVPTPKSTGYEVPVEQLVGTPVITENKVENKPTEKEVADETAALAKAEQEKAAKLKADKIARKAQK
jgi:hypothetical protein